MRPELLRRTLSLALAAAVLVSVPAVSTQAAGRRRAVTPPTATGKLTAEVSGTIIDDVTGHPVVAAHVVAGGRSTNTDAAGKYTSDITSYHGVINVEVSRSGYATKTQVLTTGGKQTLDVRVTPGAVAHVRKADNSAYDVDFDSIEFGYPVAFSGYRAAEFEDFCTAAGNAVVVDRSEIRRIVGPAVMVDNPHLLPRRPDPARQRRAEDRRHDRHVLRRRLQRLPEHRPHRPRPHHRPVRLHPVRPDRRNRVPVKVGLPPPVILSEVAGGRERRISKCETRGMCRVLRSLRFFAHTRPPSSL